MVSTRIWNAFAWSICVVGELGGASRLQRIDDWHRYIPLLSRSSLNLPDALIQHIGSKSSLSRTPLFAVAGNGKQS